MKTNGPAAKVLQTVPSGTNWSEWIKNRPIWFKTGHCLMISWRKMRRRREYKTNWFKVVTIVQNWPNWSLMICWRTMRGRKKKIYWPAGIAADKKPRLQHLFADEVCLVVPEEVEHGLRGPPVGQRGEGGRLQLGDVRVHVQPPRCRGRGRLLLDHADNGLLLYVVLWVALDHLGGRETFHYILTVKFFGKFTLPIQAARQLKLWNSQKNS